MRRCVMTVLRVALVCVSAIPFVVVVPDVHDAYRASHSSSNKLQLNQR